MSPPATKLMRQLIVQRKCLYQLFRVFVFLIVCICVCLLYAKSETGNTMSAHKTTSTAETTHNLIIPSGTHTSAHT